MSSLSDSLNETREDIPLKSGTKSTSCCNEDCLGGSKFINIAFATLTIVITIALLVQIYYGDYQVTPHGSVATDNLNCSEIGTTILKHGGNAVDAAIASSFCLAVAVPHITGLEAEGQVLIYNHRSRLIPNVIDFNRNNVKSDHLPRLVLGLAYTHQQYGSLPWKQLVEPAARIAKNGYLVSKQLVQAITVAKAEDLYNRLEPGQLLHLQTISETLMKIANISEEELYSYLDSRNQPSLTQAIKGTFNDYVIYVPNGPSSPGPLLLLNLQEIERFNFTIHDTLKPEYIYRIAETTQNVYNELNVSVNFHQGTTTNVAVIDLQDNYVSVVTGMSSLFGSGEMTTAGYVLDNTDDLKPSSRIPVIITNANVVCGRRMVFGASDIAVASQLVTSLLIGNENATESIESPRFHMLSNGTIGIEGFHLPVFNEDVLKYLETLTSHPLLVSEPYYTSNIVEKLKDDLSSHSDSRGGGIASRF